MSYTYGQSADALKESRKVEAQIKHVQTKLATAKRQQQHWSDELAKQRAATRALQQQVNQARTHHERAIITAEAEARQILMQAERDVELIRERAERQAWALRDRAYTDGMTRAHDKAMARTAVLRKR